LITTNLESRSERAGDREDLILFEIPNVAPEVMTEAEKKVDNIYLEIILIIMANIFSIIRLCTQDQFP
jgi:hypothetical protein